ncbi:aldehyde dehydrogenase family protein [Comamonas sp. GB3 AK4-5]|uniref:aldehyde dehydrogenase family protein n=1 Tax=Comamonas sp. GB3 AK4-5 TaxID=3231487 RepID=UPI00351F702B
MTSSIGCAKQSRQDRINSIRRLTEFMDENKEKVIRLLTGHAGYAAAAAEWQSSVKALKGAEQEVQQHVNDQSVDCMAVFMPSNMVLYFYVLYLVIPSLYTQRIFFRPSSHITEQTALLHQLLEPVHQLPISLQLVSQRIFIEESVSRAQLVVFTGTYKNAELVRCRLSSNRQTYVFFGQGVNPAVVGGSADIERAVQDLITARMFNTGQDCMGPNVLFVHQDRAHDFSEYMRQRLSSMVFGPRHDPQADYGPIFYSSTMSTLSQYLADNARYIQAGGTIDFSKRKIEPTILRSSLEDKPPVVEYFGPIFSIVSYRDEASLMAELDQSFYRDRAMGASVHGSPVLAKFLQANHMVAIEQTLFDIEDGNLPFGGYGQMANYVFHAGRVKPAPILLSQVVGEHF